MSRYETEEEQIEAIKSWWKKHGTALLTAILVVVLAISGWRYWQNTQYVNSANASATFEILQNSALSNNFGDVAREALKLMNESPQSPYAAAAALLHAKYSFDKGETTEAIDHLQWVLDHSPSAELKAVAQLRMARLQAHSGELAAAKSTLDQVALEPTNAASGSETSALNADIDYLKGLIALAEGQLEQAYTAFDAVVQNDQADDNLKGLAQIQLADLTQ